MPLRPCSRFLVVVACVLSHGLFATDTLKTRSDTRYFLEVVSGPWIGKKKAGVDFTSSVVQGIRYKRLSGGVGVGFDTYDYWRVVPVYGTLGFDVARLGEHAIFLDAGLGHSFTRNPVPEENQNYSFEEEGGRNFHASLGYRITASDHWRIYFVGGYKYQRLRYTERWSWGGGAPNAWHTSTVVIERVYLQIGIGLF